MNYKVLSCALLHTCNKHLSHTYHKVHIYLTHLLHMQYKKTLDSSVFQSNIPWHFRNQTSNIKHLNWKFEKLIKQDTLKDISLEQVGLYVRLSVYVTGFVCQVVCLRDRVCLPDCLFTLLRLSVRLSVYVTAFVCQTVCLRDCVCLPDCLFT